jgi:demethylmenaquinone methyltransferase/2-methoxy-6-polyprenyl-1,4-benzoquinol methylase
MDNKIFFNSLAEKWDSICYHHEEKVNYVIDKMGLKNGDSILDIGSGTGVTIPYLEERIGTNGKITALDIAEKMLKISKKKNIYDNLDFEVKDFFEYTTPKKFDHIIAYSCYPHFKDEESFFKKAYSLLEDKGKIVIAHIESKEVINSRHKEEENNIISLKLSDVEKMCELANEQGFKNIYKEDSKDYFIFVGEKIRKT